MRKDLALSCFACLALATGGQAVILDRIAVVVNNHPIKDTDIERDIRLTDFLNGDALSLSLPERKKAARRLIDQQIIRREIDVGNYSVATPEQVDAFLATIRKQRSGPPSGYGITDAELRNRLKWQLTVLSFIDQRFRPAVIVTDAEIDQYARTHRLPREQSQEQLTGAKVTAAFESWLNRAEKRAKIEYLEADLQ